MIGKTRNGTNTQTFLAVMAAITAQQAAAVPAAAAAR
jgi:hypothetical protein